VLKGEDIFDEKGRLQHGQSENWSMTKCSDWAQSSAKGESIVFDATFVSQPLRRRAAEVAAKNQKRFVIQQTRCPQEVSLRRIAQKAENMSQCPDRTGLS
jgi:predicted kinase